MTKAQIPKKAQFPMTDETCAAKGQRSFGIGHSVVLGHRTLVILTLIASAFIRAYLRSSASPYLTISTIVAPVLLRSEKESAWSNILVLESPPQRV